jgi:putative oxidoreductase
MFNKLFQTNNDRLLTLVRLVAGVVFLAHGAQKLLGWFGGYGFGPTMGAFEHMGIPAPFGFLAIAAEFFGGLGLILGLLSRVAAFGIAVEMLVAIFKVHAANGFFMNWAGNQRGEGIEYHLLALAVLVVVLLRGAGAWSLDQLIAPWHDSESTSARNPTRAAA